MYRRFQRHFVNYIYSCEMERVSDENVESWISKRLKANTVGLREVKGEGLVVMAV